MSREMQSIIVIRLYSLTSPQPGFKGPGPLSSPLPNSSAVQCVSSVDHYSAETIDKLQTTGVDVCRSLGP